MLDNPLHDKIQGNWKQMSGSVRHEWGKLTHNDVEEIKGDVDKLAGKIEVHYSVAKSEALKQIEHWALQFFEHKEEQSKSDKPAK